MPLRAVSNPRPGQEQDIGNHYASGNLVRQRQKRHRKEYRPYKHTTVSELGVYGCEIVKSIEDYQAL